MPPYNTKHDESTESGDAGAGEGMMPPVDGGGDHHR